MAVRKVNHIYFPNKYSKFWADYESVSGDIRDALDRIIKRIADNGNISGGMQAHKMQGIEGETLWNLRVTHGGSHWRILFELIGDSLYVLRLLPHDEMDKVLKDVSV